MHLFFVCECVGALALDPLELKLQTVDSRHVLMGLNLDPLQQQQVLGAAEPSPQPLLQCFHQEPTQLIHSTLAEHSERN